MRVDDRRHMKFMKIISDILPRLWWPHDLLAALIVRLPLHIPIKNWLESPSKRKSTYHIGTPSANQSMMVIQWPLRGWSTRTTVANLIESMSLAVYLRFIVRFSVYRRRCLCVRFIDFILLWFGLNYTQICHYRINSPKTQYKSMCARALNMCYKCALLLESSRGHSFYCRWIPFCAVDELAKAKFWKTMS